jgi:protein SOK2
MNNNYQQYNPPYGYYMNAAGGQAAQPGQSSQIGHGGPRGHQQPSSSTTTTTNTNTNANTNTNNASNSAYNNASNPASNNGANPASNNASNTATSSNSLSASNGAPAPSSSGSGLGSRSATGAGATQATATSGSTSGISGAGMGAGVPATGSDYYQGARTYPYQPNYMYNQIPGQINQPQPQHYNGYQQIGQHQQQPIGQIGQQLHQQQQQQQQQQQASGGPQIATSISGPMAASLPPVATPMPDTLNSSATSSVGQLQPPGIRPRVTTTMWEDEKTLCYQVDANNVSVVRRADNNMINGTKLLNVAQMTRGRRDGILKLEKVRHVVKIGSMHLKGVWIPFERALAMAQRESIVDLLYPLFVRDIKRVIQTGVTPAAAGSTTVGLTGVSGATTPALTAPPPPTSSNTQANSVVASNSYSSNSTPTANSKISPLYQAQPDYSQYSQMNGTTTANQSDVKTQQYYGYPQTQTQTHPNQAGQGQSGVQSQAQHTYATQQYPYYNQYNQYAGQQMYQNYAYQVPPTLHQQPAPISNSTLEQTDNKKKD